jgi:ubiquitin carboxyl-terminal hydrolase 48
MLRTYTQVVANAARIMEFAKAMLRESRPVIMPHNQEPVQLRIGIHTGPLVSGLVGAKMPKFTLL